MMVRIFRLSDLPHGSTNILELDDPQEYHCSLLRYELGHSNMQLSVTHRSKDHEGLIVSLEYIHYLEMPIRWWGANFQLGDIDECYHILKQIHFNETSPVIEEYYRPFRLIAIPHQFGVSKVIASVIDISTFNWLESQQTTDQSYPEG
jgi:hypothetical protein